ncbi:MAG TPA: histidine kinase [Candidatus Nanopelagicales bacterium]|nr:histidine kinase [Candidatus Nanopelagicales bacterium]
MSRYRSAAIGLAGVSLALLGEIVALALAWQLRPFGDAVAWALYNVAVTAVGALIVHAFPRHPVGWILLVLGVLGVWSTDVLSAYGARAELSGWPGAAGAQWLGVAAWCLSALMWVLALLYVPTGALASPRWRIALVGGIVGTSAYLVGWLISPASTLPDSTLANPFAVAGLPGESLADVGGVLLAASAAGAVASVIGRARGADPVLRQQLKWVGVGGLLLVGFLPVGLALWSSSPVVRALSPVVALGIVASVGAAVLRYRLFDVDRMVLRGTAYLAAAAVASGLFAASVILLGTLLGGSRPWQTAAATLVAVVCFRPVAGRVERRLERRFDPDHDARRQIDRFLDGLRAGTEPADRIEEVLRDAAGRQDLRLLLRLPASDGFCDVHGQRCAPDPSLRAIELGAEAMVQYPSAADPVLDSRLERLLAHARLALQVARLGAGLSSKVDELDASRRRIAIAADDERRRIQRDLHDGAQQRLVAVGLALRSLEGRLRADDRRRDADTVDGVVTDLGETIVELRTLVANLPLPQLDGGLDVAFRELADRSPLPVRVDVTAERLSPSVEATAYFVGSESLTNTLKHARASTVTLRAERCGATLLVTVADDGVGGAVPGAGTGLIGLRDRVAAIGGHLRIDSGRTGTTITAELPCG